MTIRSKLKATIWGSSLIILFIAALLVLELWSVKSNVRNKIQLDEINGQIVQLYTLTFEYLQEPMERKETQWRMSYTNLHLLLNGIPSSGSKEVTVPEKVILDYSSILGAFNELSAAIKHAPGSNMTAQSTTKEMQNHFSELLAAKNQAMHDWINKTTHQSNVRLLQNLQKSTIIFLGLLIFLAISVASLLFMVNKSLWQSLQKLQSGVITISGGNLDHQITINQKDELGDFAHAFNQMSSKVKSLYNAMRESEARFRSYVENTNDIFYSISADGNFKYVSPVWTQLLGHPVSEVAGRAADSFVHPNNQAAFRDFISQVSDPNRKLQEFHYQVQHKNGGWLWFSSRAAWHVDSVDGNIVLGIARDMTQHMKDEEEKHALQLQLSHAQKLESLGRLAGGVAHDFNNMIQVIQGNLFLAALETKPDSPQYDLLQEIKQAAERSSELTRQLLAFARKQTAVPQVINVDESIAKVLKMLHRLIGENIHLEWHPGSSPARVKMDPAQLDQILANLAVNARDAISGNGQLTIETTVARFSDEEIQAHAGCASGAYVMLIVSDTGQGMTAEVRSHLFEPFFTTKALGKGTGMGLATIFGIVNQNKGFISVESQVNHGTTFNIYIPVTLEEPSAPAPIKSTRQLLRSGTIMLVEDEVQILKLGSRLLESVGYTVYSASEPEEALNIARRNPGVIQLLITDVIMPGMNGDELCRELKAMCPKLKCLYISGYTADVLDPRGVLNPGVNFLQKPFNYDLFITKVAEIMDS